jgi:hypothetical protein
MLTLRRLACVAGLALLAACGGATAGNGALGVRGLSVELDRSTPVAPKLVSYERTATGLAVKGRVTKRLARYGQIRGHVAIDLVDDQGRVLARHDVEPYLFVPSRQDADIGFFRTRIGAVPPGTVGLRVSYAVGD